MRMKMKRLTTAEALNAAPVWIVLFLLVFTPLARGGVQGWARELVFMAVFGAVCLFAISRILSGRPVFEVKTPLGGPILCLSILMLLSASFSILPVRGMQGMLPAMICMAVYYLVVQSARTRMQHRRIVIVIVGTAVLLVLVGLLKISGENPFGWWNYDEIDGDGVLLTSTYGNHNHLAGFLEMALFLSLGCLACRAPVMKRLPLIVVALFLSISLVLTLSRGGWIAACFSFALFFCLLVFQKKAVSSKLLLIICGSAIVAASVFLVSTSATKRLLTATENTESATLHSRLLAWKGVMRMIRDYPVLGVGPGNFATIYTQYQPAGFPGQAGRYFRAHNDYLQFIAEVGPGCIPIMAWAMVSFCRTTARKCRHPSRLVSGTAMGSLLASTSLLIHGLVDFNFHIPANAIVFSVLIALPMSPVHEKSK